MQEILMSINPIWCFRIFEGRQKAEIRKTRPNKDEEFKVYIYCTNSICLYKAPALADVGFLLSESEPDFEKSLNCKVIGEFMCKEISSFDVLENGNIRDWNFSGAIDAGMTYDAVEELIGRGRTGYVWHISDLVTYDEPKKISEFKAEEGINLVRPPTSWRYVKTTEGNMDDNCLQDQERGG